jgi:tRNA isopentenyl-2-thiomethyl-A-37 hydroxylase MiaE
MAQNVDAKQYYGYLFEADKKPTKVLDALLRGIAIYIVSCARLADHAPFHHRKTSRLT